MRKVSVEKIQKAVEKACIEANTILREDILLGLKKALRKETKPLAKDLFKVLLENAQIAKKEGLAICQDTGLAVVYLEIGQQVLLTNGDLKEAVNKGAQQGYEKGYFRKSVVSDPVFRTGRSKASPAMLTTEIVKGEKIKITVFPKGFGSENKSKIYMLNPTEGPDKIIEVITNTAKEAGPNACPPFVVGVGIGGTFDKAAMLSKKALFRDIRKNNKDKKIASLERKTLKKINDLNIGPMGLGAKTTALAVNIETGPTHIAGLPVAVNISCHATRSKTVIL